MSLPRQDKALLLHAAQSLADLLAATESKGVIRVNRPYRVNRPQTDGWRARVGGLGRGQPKLELWLDRFTGHTHRKFFACFYSPHAAKMRAFVARVGGKLGPVRTHTLAETQHEGFFELKAKLQAEFLARPILEKYQGEFFFGLYDPAHQAGPHTMPRFLQRAAAFFFEVAEAQPRAKGRGLTRDDYPRCENRKWVAAHRRRERNGYLARCRKGDDNFRCCVCEQTMAELYGPVLGGEFAESHHKRPLGELGDSVQTTLEDLVTVCPNCHRILHRMDGKPDDITRLRAIVRRHRKARSTS